MSLQQLFGSLRTVATLVAGIILQTGIVKNDSTAQLFAWAVVAVCLFWSVYQKHLAEVAARQREAAAAANAVIESRS